MSNITTLNKTITLLGRLFDTSHSTQPIIELPGTKPRYEHSEQKFPQEKRFPEQEGISSRHIAMFLREIYDDDTLNMHSITILRRGHIICEAGFGTHTPDIWRNVYSASKSVTSLAVGLLYDDGLISYEDRVLDFFRDVKISPLSRVTLRDLKIRDLLTMTSCVMFNEASSMCEKSWETGFLGAPVFGKMGQDFNYNSLNTYMLASIVTRVAKKSLCELLDERIFSHLGIENYYWETSPTGIEKGGWGLYIHPRDLAKLGQLVLAGGKWNGKQLVSQRYLTAATTAQTKTTPGIGDYDYGFQIWVGRKYNSFLFNGMFGQNMLCFPGSDIIVVSHAGNEEMFQQSNYFKIVQKYFGEISASLPDSLPRDRNAEKELYRTFDYISQKPQKQRFFSRFRKEYSVEPAFDNLLSGKLFLPVESVPFVGVLPLMIQATENSYTTGLVSLSLACNDNGYILTVNEKDEKHTVCLGTSAPCRSELVCGKTSYTVSSQIHLTQNEDGRPVAVIKLDFLEFAASRIIKLYPHHDGTVTVKFTETPGDDFIIMMILDTKKTLEDLQVVGTLLSKMNVDTLAKKVRSSFAPIFTLKPDDK